MTKQEQPAQGQGPSSPACQALPDKLAHRALSDHRGRGAGAPSMSVQALDRLYARMFPSAICQGSDTGSDPRS